jgi:type IV secretion system protein VirD4
MLASPAWDGLLARKGGELTHFVDKEKSSVLTTCGEHLGFLSTPAMKAVTGASSFTPRLKQRKQTVYIVLPPERMAAQAGWLRLTVGSMIRAVVKEGLGEDLLVHFVLDEAASLGQLECIDHLIDKYRGYGCRAQFYYRSAGQLPRCFPKDQGRTLLSNTSKIFLGATDVDTANLVSATAGKATIIVESGGSSRQRQRGTSTSTGTSFSDGVNASHSTGTSDNWAQAPRELLKPEEVLTLPPLQAVTFPTGGLPPVRTTLVRYFEEPGLFRGGGRRRGRRGLVGACRTLAKSAVLLAGGVGLAAALAVTLDGRQAQRQARQPAFPMPAVPGPAAPFPAVPAGGGVPNWRPPALPKPGLRRPEPLPPPRPALPKPGLHPGEGRPREAFPAAPDPVPRRDKLA